MQLKLDQDEIWSLMMLVTAHAVDTSGVSQSGKQRIRQWQRMHAEGSSEMKDLAAQINAALGSYLDKSTSRVVRRKGRYVRKKETA